MRSKHVDCLGLLCPSGWPLGGLGIMLRVAITIISWFYWARSLFEPMSEFFFFPELGFEYRILLMLSRHSAWGDSPSSLLLLRHSLAKLLRLALSSLFGPEKSWTCSPASAWSSWNYKPMPSGSAVCIFSTETESPGSPVLYLVFINGFLLW